LFIPQNRCFFHIITQYNTAKWSLRQGKFGDKKDIHRLEKELMVDELKKSLIIFVIFNQQLKMPLALIFCHIFRE